MVGTFPLNVQAGSPQYTLVTQVTPTQINTSTIYITNADNITPTANAYYTIQNADGSKWCTFYANSWHPEADGSFSTTGTYSSSNTTDVFPGGSTCWCIWCKEYYDSLIAKIGGGGNTVKVSQLEWDTNLVIPDGKAIESASGEVGIIGDVSISGSLNTDGGISGGGNVTGNGVIVSGKALIVGELIPDANVTLPQIPQDKPTYTSPDLPINNLTDNVIYTVPAIQYRVRNGDGEAASFTLQAKQTSGSYTTIASVSFTAGSDTNDYTQVAVLPIGSVALRYIAKTGWVSNRGTIESDLNLTLKALPVY